MGLKDFLFGKPAKSEVVDYVGGAEYRSDVAGKRSRLPSVLQEIEGAYSITPEEERGTREQVLGGLGRAQAGERAERQSQLSKVIGGLRSGYAQNRLSLLARGQQEQVAGTGSALALQQSALKRQLAQQRQAMKEAAYDAVMKAQQGVMQTQYTKTTQGTSGAIGSIIPMLGMLDKGGGGNAIGGIGSVLSAAAPFASMIPGVGPLLGAGLSAAGGYMSSTSSNNNNNEDAMRSQDVQYSGSGQRQRFNYQTGLYENYARGGRYNAGTIGLAGEARPEMFYPDKTMGGRPISKPTVFVSSGGGIVKNANVQNEYRRKMMNHGNKQHGVKGKAAGRHSGLTGIGQGYQGWRSQLAR